MRSYYEHSNDGLTVTIRPSVDIDSITSSETLNRRSSSR